MSEQREQKRTGVAIIYYCPNDQKAANAPAVIKYRYNRQTIFLELLREACFYFKQDFNKMMLKDNFGTQWPVNREVWKELAQLDRDILLCPVVDEEEEEEEEKEIEEVVVEEEEEDDTKPVQTRPPLYRELFIHLIFLTVLITHSLMGGSEQRIYEMNAAMNEAFFVEQFDLSKIGAAVGDQSAFTNPSVKAVADTESLLSKADHSKVRNFGDACEWLDVNLRRGLFHTDYNQNDATGAVMAFNRVIGGVRFSTITQSWLDAQSAYELHEPFFPWWFGGRPAETTTTRFLQPRANWTEGWLAGQMLIFEEDLQTLTDGWCKNDTSSMMDHETEVLREVKIEVLVYNHNVNMYLMLNFRFLLDYGGSFITSHAFRPMSFTDEITLMTYGVFWLNYVTNFKAWLTLVNYILVFTRTFSELRAAMKIKQEGRPLCWDYFGGIFTILELFNLSCNYVGMSLRLLLSLSTSTQAFLDTTLPLANNTDVSHLISSLELNAYLLGAIRGLRAFSLLSACLLLFKYLELAPRRDFASFYLTGTALSRSGRNIKIVFGFFTVFVLAMAVIGEQLFGTSLREFSSLYDAFFTLTVAVAGFGGTYWNLLRVAPIAGPIFFIFFQLSVLVFITPFFLAIINDAYAVRAAALEMLKEKVRKAQEDKKRAEGQNFGREGPRKSFDKKKVFQGNS